ncbi:CorA family metal ion transporter, putative [Talaromyces stipitatus ATCC 10500]|uniref:CorA family metal ion transporter, putative n=1 Tax=Talaromyces stipitatus (strain ATCC 10500 / CBS 375.48 / QM 6759 / NRRL 1006) TaxID=441959 RepID=B8M1D6_TALSN|nr:CorA family metal ion transporter, putative [Talaromyces stipitatus ATCC 10500]EED21832.1 CorA family metal ion transporter, putative [Talaromyces stipitatus ATCC 10500]
MPTNTAQTPTASRNQPTREQQEPGNSSAAKPKKKNRNRKRRNRRQSFIASEDSGPIVSELSGGLVRTNPDQIQERAPFYRGRNISNTSLESEALLDHRDQPMMRPRRDSRLSQSFRPESFNRSGSYFPGVEGPSPGQQRSNFRYQQNLYDQGEIEEDEQEGRHITDRTPLIPPLRTASPTKLGYGTDARSPYSSSGRHRRQSHDTASSPPATGSQEYDVNNPPSVPGTPKLGVTDMGYDDAMVTGLEFPQGGRSPDIRRSSVDLLRDAVINMEGGGISTARKGDSRASSPPTASPDGLRRRRTITVPAEEDVCFPSEIAEDFQPQTHDSETGERRRRRRREWPDLSVLEEWSREEKEERSLEYRVKKISEPVLVGGRLRPQYIGWRREEEDAPYRFTYFNEEFQSTIHAQTISELIQPGGSFRDLFIPDPPELEDSSDDEEDLISLHEPPSNSNSNANRNSQSNLSGNYSGSGVDNGVINSRGTNTPARDAQRESGNQSNNNRSSSDNNNNNNRSDTQTQTSTQQDTNRESKPKRYGPRPTWWLDVLCPTDAEMRVISKAFGIHALTAEDIMMQEAREKVELFRNYYFLNYRTFEQDPNSDNYLEPVNMYVVVFREGCLSFHFSQTPHPANVRRRIRQLRDYLILSSDWISYALIDDITDVFGPLIQTIENEVDEVDDTIMQMHNTVDDYTGNGNGSNDTSNNKNDTQPASSIAPGEMLRRVGEARKKVMGMYRLLSNKADVIKGFAKRCNEQWEVAPKSEIGLYLGDIQDHIMTMTSNLTHYETLLSRAHSNYLAQINILMNERQERTADVLGKLTVLGTIVLPMNIICGMWGMNVKVPGQEVDNLYWFWSITAGLVFFGVASFLIAKRVYRIV